MERMFFPRKNGTLLKARNSNCFLPCIHLNAIFWYSSELIQEKMRMREIAL